MMWHCILEILNVYSLAIVFIFYNQCDFLLLQHSLASYQNEPEADGFQLSLCMLHVRLSPSLLLILFPGIIDDIPQELAKESLFTTQILWQFVGMQKEAQLAYGLLQLFPIQYVMRAKIAARDGRPLGEIVVPRYQNENAGNRRDEDINGLQHEQLRWLQCPLRHHLLLDDGLATRARGRVSRGAVFRSSSIRMLCLWRRWRSFLCWRHGATTVGRTWMIILWS